MTLLAIDIGGTTVKSAIWEAGNQLSQFQSTATPKSWTKMKTLLYQQTEVHRDQIHGVAISSPGVFDPQEGIVHGQSALPYIHEFPIVAATQALLGLPVSWENDANCVGFAESTWGVAQDSAIATFVVCGTGIGGCTFINGRLLRGSHDYAGEFGGLYTRHKDCMGFAAPVSLGHFYTSAKADGRDYSGREVIDLAAARDSLAAKHVRYFLDLLVDGLIDICVTVDPELIVIGGAVSQNTWFISQLQRSFRNRVQKLNMRELQPRFVAAEFHQNANLIGAAVVFQNTFSK